MEIKNQSTLISSIVFVTSLSSTSYSAYQNNYINNAPNTFYFDHSMFQVNENGISENPFYKLDFDNYSKLNLVFDFAKKILDNLEDLDGEFAEIVNNNFHDLL